MSCMVMLVMVEGMARGLGGMPEDADLCATERPTCLALPCLAWVGNLSGWVVLYVLRGCGRGEVDNVRVGSGNLPTEVMLVVGW